MKIVVNRCYGGFGLSDKAFEKYLEYKGIDYDKKENASIFEGNEYYDKNGEIISYYDIPRDDIYLVKVVEYFGEEADGGFAELKVIEIPDDIEWEIEEYDGNEWISEKHRTWS